MSFYDIDGNVIAVEGGDVPFANVKSYGAKGDGSTNDSSAIQSAITAVQSTGGVVYFPVGTYLIKSAILLYSNMTLYFEPGAKLLAGASINNMMRNYTDSTTGGYDMTENVKIIGATFDQDDYAQNCTLLFFAHAKNIVIKDCSFLNAYGTWHNLELNSTKYALVEGCTFEGSRKTSENGELLQIDGLSSTSHVGATIYVDDTVCQYVEIRGCHFYNGSVASAIGNHGDTDHINLYCRIHDCLFEGFTLSRATLALQRIHYTDIYNNTFVNCTKIVTGGYKNTFHDNRVDGATTVVGDSNTTAYNNIVDGTLSN